MLDSNGYDRTFAPRVGLHALRKACVDGAWKTFQEDVPVILRTLRARKTALNAQSSELRTRLEGLRPDRLRALANTYVVELLQVIDSLIVGSSEGNPNINGQTMEEEKAAMGLGEWKNSENDDLPVFADGVPYHDARVYGGQQFKRLLSAFGEVAHATTIAAASADVIASAAGINRLNNVPNFAWAACELATQEVRRSLQPLVKQLRKRAQFIVERLPMIAKVGAQHRVGACSHPPVPQQVMDNRRATKWNASAALLATDVEQYPHFAYAVQDLFRSFVEDTAQACQTKCLDEFLDTRTVYWHLAEDKQGALPMDRFADAANNYQAVHALAGEVFETLRDRIVSNVQLKASFWQRMFFFSPPWLILHPSQFFNFFLVPLQTTLVAGVQERTNVLSDEELEQRFEVAATKDKLADDLKGIAASLEALREMESALLENATRFSHPAM